MSIDARVNRVVLYGGVGGELQLVDRPAAPGGVPGIAGQRVLHFDATPADLYGLIGCDVWGSSDTIMLGEREIARRVTYTRIRFVEADAFTRALTEYRERRPPLTPL